MPVCASCRQENPEDARFCNACAAPLAAAPPSREQRKTVTVVFCDVTGSTALGESIDPEALRSVLARYFERMKGIVEAHGGAVEKFIGDAVMAVFGVPAVHEDDALRAVRAAAEMRAELPKLGVQARLGVNTGEVVTGTHERLATGDAVNVAARLQQAAAPGEVLLGAETRALIRDAVEVEELPPLDLKGKRDRVSAFRLLSVAPGAPGVVRRLDAPMVGRAHERKLLEGTFATVVRQQSCSLFTLLGAAGVGKSRLVREFLASIDACVAIAACLSYGEGITYLPVVEVVKQLGTEHEPESPLAVLLGEPQVPTTPEEIAWSVRKLFEATATERPLVVVFDDVHWGEETFLDLVEHIADLSRGAPILVLCIARPELLDRRPGWAGGKLNATTVLLEALDPTETETLIELLLDGEELEPGMAERIRVAAEGNPLFVEEMLAMVRESGKREVVVPPTIKALLAARLDQLDAAERGVLERGSIEGQLFHSAAVQALVGEAPVAPQLVKLVRKELVRPDRSQLPISDAYRFRHLLIRDAAYGALPKSTRADLHERFSQWLEAHGRDLVERDEIIGYHLEQACRYRSELGMPVEKLAAHAADLLTAAARAARTRGDRPAATGLLARAAGLAGPGRPALLPELAELTFEGGEITKALELLDEALEGAEAGGDERVKAIAMVERATIAIHLGEGTFERVLELAEQASATLERLGDKSGLAAVLTIRGRNLFWSGRSREADAVLSRALDLSLELGELSRARDCFSWRSIAMVYGVAQASEVIDNLDRLPDQLASTLIRVPNVYALRAFAEAYRGRFLEARDDYAHAKALEAELGMMIHLGHLAIFGGKIELLADDAKAAERLLRDGYARLGELGETGFRATVGGLLAEALVRLGRDRDAEQVLDEVAGFAVNDDVEVQIRMRRIRARIHGHRGDSVRAEQLAREAVALAAHTDYLTTHGDALLALAEAIGEREEATACLRDALALFERKGNIVQAETTRAILAGDARA